MSTTSTLFRVGDEAPVFSLPDAGGGAQVSVGAPTPGTPCTCVVFMCNHCPYVHYLLAHFVAMTRDYAARGVRFVAISANDVADYPQDGPQHMQELARKMEFGFPYLYDESQAVAKAWGAVCTPEFFVLDGAGRLAYHGRYGAARPGAEKPAGEDLSAAMDAVLAGRAPAAEQVPSMGCSIKWKR